MCTLYASGSDGEQRKSKHRERESEENPSIERERRKSKHRERERERRFLSRMTGCNGALITACIFCVAKERQRWKKRRDERTREKFIQRTVDTEREREKKNGEEGGLSTVSRAQKVSQVD